MSILRPRVGTPAALGYRWPAEWEPQAAVWLSWPHNVNTWPDKFETVPPQFTQFARLLSRFVPVHILAGGDHIMTEARRFLGDSPQVTLHDIPTDDAWCRDHGPSFLAGPRGRQPGLVDWNYNAWGQKYPHFDLDDAVPRAIAAMQNRLAFRPGIVLEGGAIDGNGNGTILTTESCLLNPNRNSQIGRPEIEQLLADFLGAKTVLWLPGGDLAGDDTDGHIDQLARFVSPNTVVAATEDNRNDFNFMILKQHRDLLRQMKNESNEPIRVIPLPMPRPLFFGKQRMPASYCNFLITNGAVVVPQFDDPNDPLAIRILAGLFLDREVIGLPAGELVWGLGAFHCLSQQEAAAHSVQSPSD